MRSSHRRRATLLLVAVVVGVALLGGPRLFADGVAWAQVCGDSTLDPGEQCDPPGSSCSGGATGTCQADCTCPLHAFHCYGINPKQTLDAGATVIDRLGAKPLTVFKTAAICAPADVGDLDPPAPSEAGHLTAYKVKARPFTKVLGDQFNTQFGTLTLDLIKPSHLLVPTAKNLVSPSPPPLSGTSLDHFSCYKARLSSGSPAFPTTVVIVDTQFETGVQVEVVKPKRVCLPANKRDESPGVETHEGHLICYRARPQSTVASTAVFLTDQFGESTGEIRRGHEICLQAPKQKPPCANIALNAVSREAACTDAGANAMDCINVLEASVKTVKCPLLCKGGACATGTCKPNVNNAATVANTVVVTANKKPPCDNAQPDLCEGNVMVNCTCSCQ